MKYFFLLIISTVLFSSSTGLYIDAGAGVNLSNKLEKETAFYTYDTSVPASIAIGYKSNTFRFEIEEFYSKNKILTYTDAGSNIASGEIQKSTHFFNSYIYKLKNKTLTSLGLGFGATNIELSDLSIGANTASNSKVENIPTIKASFAVGYTISKNLIFDIKYSYITSSTYEIDNVKYKALSDEIVSTHFRYLF